MKNNMENGQNKYKKNQHLPIMAHPLNGMMSRRMKTGSGTQTRSGLSPIAQMLKPIPLADARKAKVVGSLARVVVAKAKADDPRAKAKDSANPLMHNISDAAARAKEKDAVRVARGKEKPSKATKARKEKDLFILLMPCLPLRHPLRLQLLQHLPKKAKTSLKPSKVHQKAQVVAVNVVLGGTPERAVPP